MKLSLTSLGTISSLLIVCTVGCRTAGQVSRSADLKTIDSLSSDTRKGYAEFYTLYEDAPIPLYQINARGKPRLVAVIGLEAGKKYRYRSRQAGVPIAAKVRLALPPGTHQFAVETRDELIEVTVKEASVTSVEIEYDVLENGRSFRVYKLDYDVHEPTPLSKKMDDRKG